jgi:hypothetical protein
LELSGGQRDRPRSRAGAAIVAVAAALIGILAGCGDDSDSQGEARSYRAEVVKAGFPAEQRLGETALMRVRVRNVGEETIPALTIGVSIGGSEGEASALPFGVRDPQPGLAEPDRPVWVLAEHYPKLAGSTEPGGAEGASGKIYTFGPLKPDRVTEVVWKLTASRTGRYDLRFKVGARNGGEAMVEGPGGTVPGGSFTVTISEEPVDTTVTDSGEVVEIEKPTPPAK